MGKSVYKQVKEDGKASLPESKVKQRKNFAPKTKPFKSKGSGKGKDPAKRNKKVSEEDEQEFGEVPLKREPSRHEKRGRDMKRKGQGKRSEPIDHSKLGSVPLKRDPKPKNKIQQMDNQLKKGKAIKENSNISKFIECILSKNYSEADKYIKQAVESKLQSKIEKELTKPLF
tara:strand:- start:10378 stop:10893 length:516 start_codon:yes stop_codon:yes gene_type:complete